METMILLRCPLRWLGVLHEARSEGASWPEHSIRAALLVGVVMLVSDTCRRGPTSSQPQDRRGQPRPVPEVCHPALLCLSFPICKVVMDCPAHRAVAKHPLGSRSQRPTPCAKHEGPRLTFCPTFRPVSPPPPQFSVGQNKGWTSAAKCCHSQSLPMVRPGAAAAPPVFLTARSGADAQGYCPLNNLALSGARPAQLDKGWLDLPLPWFPLWTGWMCQACACVAVPSDSRCPGRSWVCSPPTAYVEPPWLFPGGRGLGGHSSPRGGVLGTGFKSRARRVGWRVGCGSRSVHVSGLEHGRSRPGAAVRVNTGKATCRAAWRVQELGWVTACQADGRMSWLVPSLGIVLSRGARHRARGCVRMSVCTHVFRR